MKDIKLLFDKFGDAEYRQLLLEPVLIYGVLLGVMAFLFSFLFKERKMQLAALIVIIVSALTVVPYLKARSSADKRAEKLFSAQAELIEAQRETRKDTQWAYFAVAGLAGVTLLMGAHKGKPGMFVGIATIGAGVCLVIFSMSMHLKDAQIYHPNLREAPKLSKADKRPKAEAAPGTNAARESVRLAQRSAGAAR